jgi:hypothetical protein
MVASLAASQNWKKIIDEIMLLKMAGPMPQCLKLLSGAMPEIM